MRKLLIAAALLITLLLPCLGISMLVDKVVAVVNGEIITLLDLEKESLPVIKSASDSGTESSSDQAIYDIQRRVLNDMIDRKLAKGQAAKLGIKVQDSEIEKAIEQIKKRNSMTQEQLIEQLEREGVTLDQLREKLREDVERSRLLDHQIRARVVVTDEQLKAYYEQNKDQFTGKNQIRLKNILVPVNPEDDSDAIAAKEKIARDLMEQIKVGTSFEEVAKNAPKSGDLGGIDVNDLAPYLKEAVEPLQSGQVTDVIRGPYGFQIVKVVSKDTAGLRPFEDVKEEIRKEFYEKRMTEQYEAWVKELREKASIRVNF
jgi:peptidyl-prolyl cis-trans isomerase SurA